jgi:RimJ/RimL family protein N-acetyltransferase
MAICTGALLSVGLSGDDAASVDQPLLTRRLRLRPFVLDDLEAAHGMWADPEVGRWIGGRHARLEQSVEELQRHLRHQERHGFAF